MCSCMYAPLLSMYELTDTENFAGTQARSQVRKRGGSEKKKSGPKVGVGRQKGEGAGGGSAPSRASRGSF